jgi:hypothetical protein
VSLFRRAVSSLASLVLIVVVVASGLPAGASQLAGVPTVVSLGVISPASLQPNDIVHASPVIEGPYAAVTVLLLDEYGGTHALQGRPGTDAMALVADWWPEGRYTLGAIQVVTGTLFGTSASCFYCYVYYDVVGDQTLEGAYADGFTSWRSAITPGVPFTPQEIDGAGTDVLNPAGDDRIADLDTVTITGAADLAFPADGTPRVNLGWGVDERHPYDSGWVTVVPVHRGVADMSKPRTFSFTASAGARGAAVDLTSLPNGRYRVAAVTLLTDNRYQLHATLDGATTYPPLIGGGAVHADLSALRFSVGVPPDVTPPVLTVPDSLSAEAVSAAGSTVAFAASADDAVDGLLTPSCSPTSGSTFALGTTTVTCVATDLSGNTATSSFDIQVSDTTAPVIAVPTSVSAEATSAAGAEVVFVASASDLVDGAVTPSCAPASGATFALGSTTVTCAASDVRGNASSASFDVSVVDTTAPTFDAVPALGPTEAVGPAGAPVLYAIGATDLVDGAVTPTCDLVSGSVFPIGTTQVTCSATDAAGNTSSMVFDISVVDTTAPMFDPAPALDPVEAVGPAGAPVVYVMGATDIVDGAVPVTCAPSSGSTFPLGTTEVGCSTTDTRGNATSTTFRVTVHDTTAPTIAFAGEGTYDVDETVSITCSATDLVSAATCSPTSMSAPAASFTAGPHSTSFSATDAAGNRATAVATFEITPTIAGMTNLTTARVTKEQLASSLAAKLQNGSLQAYRQQLRAQVGKGVTQADADLLTAYSYAL